MATTTSVVDDWTIAELTATRRDWWVPLLAGIVSIAAGGILLITDWTVADLAVFVGALLVARGMLTAFAMPIEGVARGWGIILGGLEVGLGLAVVAWPAPTLLVVAALIGSWILVRGVFTISASMMNRDWLPFWGLLLALGIVQTLFAVWLLARPGLTLVATVLAIGLWALTFGIVEVIVALEQRPSSARVRAAARLGPTSGLDLP